MSHSCRNRYQRYQRQRKNLVSSTFPILSLLSCKQLLISLSVSSQTAKSGPNLTCQLQHLICTSVLSEWQYFTRKKGVTQWLLSIEIHFDNKFIDRYVGQGSRVNWITQAQLQFSSCRKLMYPIIPCDKQDVSAHSVNVGAILSPCYCFVYWYKAVS